MYYTSIKALGVEPRAFWRLTFFELNALFEHVQDEQINMMSLARFVGTAALNSNPYLKKPFKETDIMKLPTDPKPKLITKEEFVSSLNKMKSKLPFNVA